MDKNIKLTIAYDGTDFCGFQIQKDDELPTIQGSLQKALKLLCKKDITVEGSGRTDSGVHGFGQVVNFHSDLGIPEDKWGLALKPYLPDSIVIRKSEYVPEDFHSRFSAKKKTYRYLFYKGKTPNPFFNRYAHYVSYPIDFKLINEACEYFKGSHDFRAFCKAGAPVDNFVREITDIKLIQNEEGLCPLGLPIDNKEDLFAIEITGTGFLWNMVRIIAGTLINVGTGKIDPKQIPVIIGFGDRSKAGVTLPPNGLYLTNVEYL